MKRYWADDWFLLLVFLLILIAMGCANRVAAIAWAELTLPDLQEICRDYDSRLKGCVVSRADGDTIYVLKP